MSMGVFMPGYYFVETDKGILVVAEVSTAHPGTIIDIHPPDNVMDFSKVDVIAKGGGGGGSSSGNGNTGKAGSATSVSYGAHSLTARGGSSAVTYGDTTGEDIVYNTRTYKAPPKNGKDGNVPGGGGKGAFGVYNGEAGEWKTATWDVSTDPDVWFSVIAGSGGSAEAPQGSFSGGDGAPGTAYMYYYNP